MHKIYMPMLPDVTTANNLYFIIPIFFYAKLFSIQDFFFTLLQEISL